MPGAVFLEGDGATLRTIEEDDLEFIRDTIDAPAVRRTLARRLPVNLDQEREFYESVICGDEHVNLLICTDGEAAGTIGLHPADAVSGSAELGLFLAEEYWGQGLGTEASRLLTDYAFRERRLHRIKARVLDGNVGSRRIWEKLGFRHEATFEEAEFQDGEYVDVHLFAILEDEWWGEERGD